jgi:hypothetical protein
VLGNTGSRTQLKMRAEGCLGASASRESSSYVARIRDESLDETSSRAKNEANATTFF